MYTYEPLGETGIQTIYHVFSDAFSDYQVNLGMSLDQFRIMTQRRGYTPAVSVGAFRDAGHEPVGFVLNCLRNWEGKSTAYDAGTGVSPASRRQGVTSQMFDRALDLLARNNVKQYLLEVLQQNQAAFELYKKQGFTVTRAFSCFEKDAGRGAPEAAPHRVQYVSGFSRDEWELLKTFWDFHPSWQNSIDSIEAVREKFVYATVRRGHQIAGYGVIEKRTGDIPQLAVGRKHRRNGIAGSIAASLAQRTDADKLRVVNVDHACLSARSFLTNVGFRQTVMQYEMVLPL